jgi:hypothetical protein
MRKVVIAKLTADFAENADEESKENQSYDIRAIGAIRGLIPQLPKHRMAAS